MADDQWRPVVGYENSYEVSDHGQVRSLDRVITFPDGKTRFAAGRILKPWNHGKGNYPKVQLQDNGRNRRVCVNILVLEAFIGPRPDGYVCCHGDGDPANNHVSNLRWGTYSENNRDIVRHGRNYQANKSHCAQGHEYTSENTRLYTGRGRIERVCKACVNAASRENKRRKRAAA